MRICTFCASSNEVNGDQVEVATETGILIGRGGHTLIYGGSTLGLMGHVARATRSNGGRVVGIIPKMWVKEIGGMIEHEVIVAEDMLDRKRKMSLAAEAFITLPGGIGTLDELTDVISAKQVGEHTKPIVVVNSLGYFDKFMDQMETSYSHGFTKEKHRGIFHVTASPGEAMDYIFNYKPQEFHKIG